MTRRLRRHGPLLTDLAREVLQVAALSILCGLALVALFFFT
ncbi:hypothetical protein [Caulobacter sp.]